MTRQFLREVALAALVLLGCGSANPVLAADIKSNLAVAETAAQGGDLAAGISALEQAVEKLRHEAPMTVKNFLVVGRPAKHFGDFEARANAQFDAGETLQFYLEPKNLVTSRGGVGNYEPAFEVDMQVFDAEGEEVATKEKFGSFRLKSRSPVQDIYMNLTVTLNGAPAGEYKIQFVIRDLNSEKSATVASNVTLN